MGLLQNALAKATEVKEAVTAKVQDTNAQLDALSEATGLTKKELLKEIGKGAAQQAKANIKAKFGR